MTLKDNLHQILIRHTQALREVFAGRLMFGAENHSAQVEEDDINSHGYARPPSWNAMRCCARPVNGPTDGLLKAPLASRG
jgi:hypothetical protein